MKKYPELTIKEASVLLEKKELSSKDLTEMVLDVAEEKNGDINAYLEIFDDCLEQAEEADKLRSNGNTEALCGVPIAIKDNILIKDRRVTAASKILEGYRAVYDATVISKLKTKGSVFIGRTNLDEFAMGASTENSAYGSTKNPLDTTRVPGGSSGGSAAAIAMGGALGALGSDTAGSIRQPASFCGLVGLKPTYGSVSRHGLIALGSSLDVIGPMTKTVGDAEILFNSIKGKDSYDSTSVDESMFPKKEISGKPRIGIFNLDELAGVGAKIESYDNFNASVNKMRDLGYSVEEISLKNIKYAVPTYYVILPAEASSNLARFDGVRYGLSVDGENGIDDFKKTKGAGFGKEVRRRIIIGTYVLSAGYSDEYYKKALKVRELISQDFREAFKSVDIIMTPTTASSAFKLGEKVNDPVAMYLEDIFTVPANHTGIPALTVPSNKNKDGGFDDMPLGVQFMAPHMHESLLFTVGKDFEK